MYCNLIKASEICIMHSSKLRNNNKNELIDKTTTV